MLNRVRTAVVAACLLSVPALVLAAPAQAHGFAAGRALLGTHTLTQPAADIASASCPAGVPVQTITVVNQANVRPKALALVEGAVTDQSMQVRAAWGTPCVQFGPGGWIVTLTEGAAPGCAAGCHTVPDTTAGVPDSAPYADVATGADQRGYRSWTVILSHEVIETVTDPYGTWDPIPGRASPSLEICDAFYSSAYPLDHTWVSDWALPAYFEHPFTAKRVSFDGAS